ncbi:hypothetical protein PC9H_011100 [Pleurotus ostreatus]|uniref:Uncharacterized protein n=1 Tax=Pleurotus ostreatus TaxID=5322 RepID=A0A8H7DML2_PLEOS|nr:uncharacterized protein PC9H_011100 [Pleurotus ostreatus]KAF7422936.1 hypothetical protein PC9H_011100 [Pleurotus ostreatus]
MSETDSQNLKVAIVTGASSGIGKASAIALAQAGWNVVITARRIDALLQTAEQCDQRALVVAGDVTDEKFVQELFAQAVEQFGKPQTCWHTGRVDLLFNNAGISAPGTLIEELTLETFQNVMNVNLVGPFLCTREAFKVFKAQTPAGGRIINNGSLSAHVPRPHTFPYACSKHAISGLTKCTALDGRAHNITCTQIDIGNAHTDMVSAQTQGILQPNGAIIPEATFDVKHVADSIVHIAQLPNDVTVLEMNIMASKAPYVGRG